jgi:hypothetical protein
MSCTHDYSRSHGDYAGQSVVTMKLPFQHLQQLRSLSLSVLSQDCEVQLQSWPAEQHTTSNTAGSKMSANSSSGTWDSTSSEGQHQPSNPLQYVGNNLTTLDLHNISLAQFPGGWSCLTALTALRQLGLSQLSISRANSFGEVLPRLTTLTQLSLHGKLGGKLQAAMSKLPWLRELELCEYDPHVHDSPQGPGKHLALPSSLTRMQVDLDGPQIISSHSTPSLAALQHLELDKIYRMDMTLISGMLQLTHLQLFMNRANFSDHSMAMLADGLRYFLQLQHLDLQVEDYSYLRKDPPAVERQQCPL